MGDLDVRIPDRQQPGLGEATQDAPETGQRQCLDLHERHPPSYDADAVSWPGEPQQEHSRDRLLVGRELRPDGLGEGADRPGDAADGDVPRVGEPVVGPLLPHLGERDGQQRQQSWLVAGLVDHRLGQPVLEGEARRARRAA